MDYNLAANRDLVQAEEEKILKVASTLNSRSPGKQRTQEALLVGLKLGSLSHLEEISGQQSQNLGLSVMESPSCGSLKRARAPNNPQVPSCLVDGCNSDLSKCRDYHRRHKVCEPHSKTPKVTIRGQEQRFCQQCSRFHSLGEFDDGKRSCRKRLDGHNRRRRKAQPDPSLSSSRFLTNIQDTQFIPFSSPQIFPAAALGSGSWNGILKSEESDSVLYSSSSSHQQLSFSDRKLVFSASSSHRYKPQIQFPFMQGSSKDLRIGSSVRGISPDPNPMSGNNNGCGSQKTLPSCLLGPLSNSECALSLLSSSLPAAAQASHQKDVGTTMQFGPLEPSHLMPTFHYNLMGAGEPTSSFLAAPGSLHGMLRSRHDGSSASGSQSDHTPSFSWE